MTLEEIMKSHREIFDDAEMSTAQTMEEAYDLLPRYIKALERARKEFGNVIDEDKPGYLALMDDRIARILRGEDER